MNYKPKRQPQFVLSKMEHLRVERVSRGMTRQELGEESGIFPVTIALYENSGTQPSRKNCNKLAKIFDWEEWK